MKHCTDHLSWFSEFSLANGQNSGVEWYESASARPDYSFDTPPPSSSAANYGTFEDEPPLLEGTFEPSRAISLCTEPGQ